MAPTVLRLHAPSRRGRPLPAGLGRLAATVLALVLAALPTAAQEAPQQRWERVFYGQWDGHEALLHNSSMFFGKLAFGDLDGDGDADLLLGKQDGRIDRFQNTGRPGAPVWRLMEENLTSLRAQREGESGPATAIISAGSHAAPFLVDIDQDEDLDLFVGTGDGRLMFFRNVGNPVLPAFTLVSDNFLSRGFGANLVPAFADVDNNRSPDLFVGNLRGDVYLLVNQGSQRRAAFCVEFPPADALPSEEPPCRPVPQRVLSVAPENNAAPGLVDWDGDGDPDLFVGKSNGTIAYYENKGRAVDPDWRLSQERFLAIDDGGFAAPRFLDANDDGRPDILIGSSTNQVRLYTNKDTGSVLDVWKVTDNMLDVRRVGSGLRQVVVAAGDLDGDKDLDLLVGDRSGRLMWLENTGTPTAPAWRVKRESVLAGAVRENVAPWLADMDGDGDLDVLVGGQDGRVWLLRNVGTATEARFHLETTNYAGIDVGNDSVPVTTDIDGDGDPDLLVGNRRGLVIFYRNEGSAGAPDFQLATTSFAGVNVGVSAAPALFDANGDGRMDLVVGSRNGALVLSENGNEPGNIELDAWTLKADPWPMFRTAGYSTPRFADLNGDGRPDLLIGDADGNLHLWYNRGTPPPREGPAQQTAAAPGSAPAAAAAPQETAGQAPVAAVPVTPSAFQSQSGLTVAPPAEGSGETAQTATQILLSEPQRLGPLAPLYTLANETFGDLRFKGRVRPAFGDLNGDGLVDLVVGTEAGQLVHYRNSGSAGEPKWSKAADNLGGFDAGGNPTPLLYDLDGDGLLDLIVGTEAGQVLFYRNSGQKSAPAFTRDEGALASINVGRNAAPAVGFVDGDDRADLIVGDFSGHLWAFVREGEAQSLNFKLVDRRYVGVDVGVAATPFVGDIDRDEVPDLLVGSDQGRISVFTRTEQKRGSQAGWGPGPDYLKDLKFPFGTTPRLVDIDGDGDQDLITGTEKGTLYLYRNDALGSPGGPPQ